MKKITTIEKDCFYAWFDKTTPEESFKDIIIGDSVGGLLKSSGVVKFKKFFEKDLKNERSVAYRYESRFKRENCNNEIYITAKNYNRYYYTIS